MNLKNIIKEFESHEKTILIRSKEDETLRFDMTYVDDKIFKVETQGNFKHHLHDKDWLDLFINFTTGSKMDFDKLRDILSRIPEIYVKDIV